ncbi:MAG: hypothetical protein C9356_02585 [Oleiphilus sp.]|nr:MAG: hypothetical protein C9356_02585 [Oleiphilus sp.]
MQASKLCGISYPAQKLIEERARKAVVGLPPRCKRVLMFLVCIRKATTGQIAHECQCGNVSDAVILMQSQLRQNGLLIRNYLPEARLKNRFGDLSHVHLWELVGIAEV